MPVCSFRGLLPAITRFRLAILVGTAGAILVADVANAQPRRISRRQDIDELNDFLIETESDSRFRRGYSDDFGQNDRPDLSKVDIGRVRQLLEAAAREASNLAQILNDEYRQVPGLRPYLSDVFKLRARSAVLAREVRNASDLERYYTNLSDLNQDWQLLSHHLHQVRGLSRAARDSIAKIDNYDKVIVDEFSLESHQLDRRQLVAKSSALATDIRSLIDDIELELGSGQTSQMILIDGRKAQQQANHVAYVAAWGERDEIVDEYKRFDTIWRQLSNRLYKVDNRYIERGVRRVARADSLVREALLMPQEANLGDLAHLTDVLMRDVDEFFARTPLKLLVQLDNAEYALTMAEEFYGMCQNFRDLVDRNEPMSELSDAYRYVEQSGAQFQRAFRPLKSSAGQIVLREIGNGLIAMREEMHYTGSFDRREAIELAAALENLADHLAYDLEAWVRNRRPTWGSDAVREAQRFDEEARNLHSYLQRDRPVSEIQDGVGNLKDTWRTLSGYLRRRNPEQRDHIELLRYRITPKLVDLMTLLDL